MLPSSSPVFIRASRLHDELFARELECARQVFADKGPHQCALNVEGEGVSAFVDLIGAKGGLVPALRILRGPSGGLWLRVTFHDLDRQVSVAREDKQPGRVGPVNFPVCTFCFEPGQLPRSTKRSRRPAFPPRSWPPARVIVDTPISKGTTPSKRSFFIFGSPSLVCIYGFRFCLLLSDPPFFGVLRGTGRLVPRSLRLRPRCHASRRASVGPRGLRCSPPDGPA
jgi:hypothetical protein